MTREKPTGYFAVTPFSRSAAWAEENSSRPRHILSVRGVGYRFVP